MSIDKSEPFLKYKQNVQSTKNSLLDFPLTLTFSSLNISFHRYVYESEFSVMPTNVCN